MPCASARRAASRGTVKTRLADGGGRLGTDRDPRSPGTRRARRSRADQVIRERRRRNRVTSATSVPRDTDARSAVLRQRLGNVRIRRTDRVGDTPSHGVSPSGRACGRSPPSAPSAPAVGAEPGSSAGGLRTESPTARRGGGFERLSRGRVESPTSQMVASPKGTDWVAVGQSWCGGMPAAKRFVAGRRCPLGGRKERPPRSGRYRGHGEITRGRTVGRR